MVPQPRQPQCPLVWFFVYEQQVGPDVAFSVARPSAFQCMVVGGIGQWLVIGKGLDEFIYQLWICAVLFEVAPKLGRGLNRPHPSTF